jgi:hypothetical protein
MKLEDGTSKETLINLQTVQPKMSYFIGGKYETFEEEGQLKVENLVIDEFNPYFLKYVEFNDFLDFFPTEQPLGKLWKVQKNPPPNSSFILFPSFSNKN